jgi:hypothetical protein
LRPDISGDLGGVLGFVSFLVCSVEFSLSFWGLGSSWFVLGFVFVLVSSIGILTLVLGRGVFPGF